MPTRIFCIMCKLKLWYLTILWKTRWVGWGGGLKQFWKSRWKGGIKKTCLPLGGWIFSGITQLAPTCTSHPLPLKKKTEVGKKRIGYYFLSGLEIATDTVAFAT